MMSDKDQEYVGTCKELNKTIDDLKAKSEDTVKGMMRDF